MDDKTVGSEIDYRGQVGQTRQETVHFTCGNCGLLFGAQVYRSINVATDPEVGEQLEKGVLNALTCPDCDATCLPNVPLTYHDPEARCLALVLPEALRHRELQARAELLLELAADPADVQPYVREAPVVFGTPGLIRLLDEGQVLSTLEQKRKHKQSEQQAGLERRQAELEQREGAVVGREEDIQTKQEDLLTRKAKLVKGKEELARAWSELEREREALQALSVELQARERDFRERARAQPQAAAADGRDTDELERVQPGPDAAPEVEDLLLGRPREEVDRWRAGDDPSGCLVHQDELFLLLRPGADGLQRLTAGKPSLMVQLHGFDSGPLVALVVLPDGVEQDQQALQACFWTLDPADPSDRAALELLLPEVRLHLDLYDDEARPVSSWELSAPLQENLKHLLQRADLQLEGLEPEARDFAAAVRAYHQLGDERLGRKQHNFSDDSFQTLPSPAAARLALGIVSYWSEPDNQDYLLLVKSFPAIYWREIRERVLRRALEFGLALTPPLADFALERKLASSREELLRAAISNFAEVSLRLKPSDLDPVQEWENWKLLLADCAVEGMRVDPEIDELAAASAKRAGSSTEDDAAAGDLSLLDNDDLLPLLTEREARRDAALELCERGDEAFLEPVFNAVCNMTRAEVARVLPAMVDFGDAAVPLLIQGLRHRKSFVRQGCALALGALKAGDELEPLIDMLLSEPTNVWKEAARALGDMGPRAIGALIAGARSADGDGRERIAWSLAQAALGEVGLAEVETMAAGKNARLAKVATRALEVMEQVRLQDQEVRGGAPMKEQTIVRSFSKRFFEALAGEVTSLSEDDIVAQEEVLNDSGRFMIGEMDEPGAMELEVLQEVEAEQALEGSGVVQVLDDEDVVGEEVLSDDYILEEQEVDVQEDDILDELPGRDKDGGE